MQHRFGPIADLTDYLAGRPLARNQPYCLAGIDNGDVILSRPSCLAVSLGCGCISFEVISTVVPLRRELIAERASGVLVRPGQPLDSIEHMGQHGIGFPGRNDSQPSSLRVGALRASQERCPDPGSIGPRRQHRRETPRRGYAAGGKHRNLGGLEHLL